MNIHASKASVVCSFLGLLVLVVECYCREDGISHHKGDLQVDGVDAFAPRAALDTHSLGPVMRRASQPGAGKVLVQALPSALIMVEGKGTPAPDAAPPIDGQGESLHDNTPAPSAEAAPPLEGQGEWWGPTPAPSGPKQAVKFSLTFIAGALVGIAGSVAYLFVMEQRRRKTQEEKKDMFAKDTTETEEIAEGAGAGLENKDAEAKSENIISKTETERIEDDPLAAFVDPRVSSSSVSTTASKKEKSGGYRAARSQRKKGGASSGPTDSTATGEPAQPSASGEGGAGFFDN